MTRLDNKRIMLLSTSLKKENGYLPNFGRSAERRWKWTASISLWNWNGIYVTKVQGMIFLLDCTQGPRSLNRSRLHLISYSFKLISYGKNKHSGQIGACAEVSIFRRPCENFSAKQKKILLSRKIKRRKLKRQSK